MLCSVGKVNGVGFFWMKFVVSYNSANVKFSLSLSAILKMIVKKNNNNFQFWTMYEPAQFGTKMDMPAMNQHTPTAKNHAKYFHAKCIETFYHWLLFIIKDY